MHSQKQLPLIYCLQSTVLNSNLRGTRKSHSGSMNWAHTGQFWCIHHPLDLLTFRPSDFSGIFFFYSWKTMNQRWWHPVLQVFTANLMGTLQRTVAGFSISDQSHPKRTELTLKSHKLYGFTFNLINSWSKGDLASCKGLHTPQNPKSYRRGEQQKTKFLCVNTENEGD